MEKGPGFASGLRDIVKYISVAAFGNALIAWYFWSTKTIIQLDVAAKVNLPHDITVSWVFLLHMLNGIMTLGLVLYYKQPLVVAGVIPLYPMMAAVMKFITFREVMGAFLMAGIIIILLSISGMMRKIVEYLPVPIVMGMIAAVLLPYGVALLDYNALDTRVWAAAIIAYLVVLGSKLGKKVPAALIGMIVGLIGITLTGGATWGKMYITLPSVTFVMPQITLSGFLQLTIPTVVLVVGMNTLQAAGSMMAEDYDPPVTAMTLIPAIGTLVSSFFGSTPPCPAGPTTAIVAGRASGEDKKGRYVSALVCSVLMIIFSASIVGFMALERVVPASFIALISGMAMIDVILSCFLRAFTGKFRFGALFAFFVTATAFSKPISLLKIGPAFWGLVVGVIVSLLLDRGDFSTLLKTNREKAKRATA